MMVNSQEPHVPLFGPSGVWQGVFPSEASARHYLRLHGLELARDGVLLRPFGRWHVRPRALAAAMERIAQRQAEAAFAPNVPA